MRTWRNWQTRTAKDRVVRALQVRVLLSAPKKTFPFGESLFFGVAFIFILNILIRPKPVLIIDSLGFIDNSTAVSMGGKIYWNQVIDINVLSLLNRMFLCVNIKNPDEILDDLNPIKKAVTDVNAVMTSSVIQIPLNSTDIDCEEACQLMQDYWQTFKTSPRHHRN